MATALKADFFWYRMDHTYQTKIENTRKKFIEIEKVILFDKGCTYFYVCTDSYRVYLPIYVVRL